MLRGGTIYAAWGSGLNNGGQVVPGVEWAQISTSHKPSATTGYFDLTGDTAATYPALVPDGAGNVLMLYERMGSTVMPEARYVVRGEGQPNFTGAGQLLKAGEASYRPTLCGTRALPVCRWGDFEATSFDGQGRIWVAGEYANTHTDPTVAPWFGRNWGTWIGAITLPSPLRKVVGQGSPKLSCVQSPAPGAGNCTQSHTVWAPDQRILCQKVAGIRGRPE